MGILSRRDFLKGSAGLAGAAATGPFTCVEVASAAPIEVPVVDRLAIRVLVDGFQDNFLPGQKANGVEITRPPRPANVLRALHNQFGLSLLLESERAGDQRTVMLDFGYTPEALLNNIELLAVDPRKITALVMSHGHFDHLGGLMGFIDKYRNVLPENLPLYAGGEDNFCRRHLPSPGGPLAEWGTIDRRELAARRVTTVLAENPTVVTGHAFTTGKIQRTSIERVLPNTMVEFSNRDGLGCDASHYTSAELQGKIVPDEHIHEHATCFNVKDRGLVVITSCGHAGIINTVRQAREVSGVQKLHALVGGMHLGPAPAPYLEQVVRELKSLEPDVVVPMHCSGLNFAQIMREQMPDKLLISTTGSRVAFGA